MYHYQLVSADAWQDESARLAGLDYFSRPKRIKHFYDSDYRDVVKKLVADPESCKDFYQVLQQVGLPYQTYYHKIPDKVAKVLATALFTESAILLELPLPSWIYNNSTFNSAYVKKKFKKIPYYQPDDSWITVDLVNHRPELIAIRDGANIHKQLFTIETSGEEIFLRHCDPFSATKVLPKVHLLIGGNQGDTDLTLRGEKQLNVKNLAQAWLDELSELLRSGNSPFTVEQDERLASIINYGFSPQHFSPKYNYNSEPPFRPDEQIGELFYQILLILNETKFITAVGRIGDLGHDESEGAIIRDPRLLRQTIKSLHNIRHSEGFDKSDYSYKSDKLARIANEYLSKPLILDGSGDDNDYESKLKAQIKIDVETDELNDIENLYFTAIKLLKHLRTPGIIRNIETRRAYKLKAKKLTYQHVELKPADTIELTLNKNYKYKITARDYGYQFIGRFDKNNRVKVKIPTRWSHAKSWDLTATPVEHSFIDEFFPALKTQYQNMLSMQGFTIGESDAGIMHANIMGGPEKPLHNLASTMQIMGGAVNLYIAATIGATGVGTPLAATIGFVGIDNIQAGVRSLFSEDTTTTYGAKFLEWAVVPKGYGEIAYALIDVGTVGKASTLLKATHQTANIVKFETINSAKSGQIVKPTEITITVENISVNQRNVISLKSVDDIALASKELLKTKPSYSPVPAKWIEKGGKIEILDNNSWKYINKDGISITYEFKNIDGKDVKLPNFSRYLHPDKKIAEVDIGVFSGRRKKDAKIFLQIAELKEIPKGYAVHHSQPNGVMQLVEEKIHKEFTHIGGHGLYK
ncbi:HNH endonuclease [Orbaceae bacterium ESL0721]|nr:HNH endonuclease [Orbaceae bacterium ESL0721]